MFRFRPSISVLLFACTLAALALATASHAHTRSLSHSSWQIEESGAQVTVRIPRLELTRLGMDAPPGRSPQALEAAAYLAERLRLESEGGECRRSSAPAPRNAPEGSAAFRWRYECDGPPTTVSSAILLEAAPSHLHFARLAGERRVVERVLTEGNPSWNFAGSENTTGTAAAHEGGGIADYIAVGVEHILSGWDHLAFVIALLLVAGTLGEVARLVTGFTIAHSVTLGLAVLGVVNPNSLAVEAVIGYSVALVAAENSWARAERPRAIPALAVALLGAIALGTGSGFSELPTLVVVGLGVFTLCHFALLARSEAVGRIRGALAFAFGLVHGFGFAGVLGEMQLPTERLVPALFGFNVGVELGQLAVVALVWPLLRLLARSAQSVDIHRWIVDGASAAICGIGLYWFVARAFGVG